MPRRTSPFIALATARLSRRALMAGAAAAGLLAGAAPRAARAPGTQPATGRPCHSHRAACARNRTGQGDQDDGYNGPVPGPLLRLREGQPVAINVINESGYPNLIHWHGLFIPSTRMAQSRRARRSSLPAKARLYSFTPKPTGTRWYHSHAMAMTDLSRAPIPASSAF